MWGIGVSYPCNSNLCWFRSSNSKRGNSFTRGLPWILEPRDYQVRREVTILAKASECRHWEEVELYSGSREEYVWHLGDPLGRHLVFPCPIFRVDGKVQQSHPEKILVTRVWPCDETLRPAEVLAEGAEWTAGRGGGRRMNINCSLERSWSGRGITHPLTFSANLEK